jgi:hypothetical protein
MWGASVQQQLNLSVSPSMDYKFEGIGDFNGDFSDDLLLRHKDGRTFVWYLNGSKVTAKRQTSHKMSSAWVVQGVGDFNSDGKADILWRNDYRLNIWEMSGHTRLINLSLGSQASKSLLNLKGLGDYDNNGHLDIFWQQKGQVGSLSGYLVNLDGSGNLVFR